MFARRPYKGFVQSSWFWEARDLAYSQMGTIPRGGAENAERGCICMYISVYGV